MLPAHTSCKVEIKKLKFETEAGILFPGTALIHLPQCHYPYGAVRWVSSLEGFFGLFLMSYFNVAFERKILR